jgi:hypothetical protein
MTPGIQRPRFAELGAAEETGTAGEEGGGTRLGVNGFERCADLACALVAVARLLLQAALDDRPQSCRNLRRKRLPKDFRSHLEARLAPERAIARGHFEEGDTERPDIATGAGFFASEDFGRDVRERSDDRARIGG